MEIKQTYPIFKVTDLIEGYRGDMGIDLTMDMFNNPNPDTWQQVFLRIAAKVLGLQPMELHEILRSVPEKVEHFDLYETCLVNVRLAFLLRKLLADVGCQHEFTLVSLRRPEKKQLVGFLSPILNFVRFQVSQEPYIEAIVAKEKAEMDKNALLLVKVQQLKQQIMEREQKRDDMMKAEKSSCHEYNKAMETVKNNKDYLQKLKDQSQRAEEMKTEVKALLDKKTAHLEELKDQVKSALSRLVQSPMRLQQDVQKYKELHPALQKKYDNLKTDYWKVKEEVERLTVASEDMKKLNEKRNEIESIFNGKKNKKQLLSQMKASMDELAKQQVSLEQQCNQLKTLSVKKRDHLNEMEAVHASKMNNMMECCLKLGSDAARKNEMIVKKKKEIASHLENRDLLNKLIEDNREKAKAMSDRITESLKDHQESERKELSAITKETIDKEVEQRLAELDKEDK